MTGHRRSPRSLARWFADERRYIDDPTALLDGDETGDDWDDLPRTDSFWSTLIMCPVLLSMSIRVFRDSWSVTTYIAETGIDPVAQTLGEKLLSPKDAFKSNFKELSNTLIVFTMGCAIAFLGVGYLTLLLPGEPSAPIQISFAASMLMASSRVGWEVGELLTKYSFSKAYGKSPDATRRVLVPHALIGWVTFAAAIVSIYS